jgi:hypothetical protein
MNLTKALTSAFKQMVAILFPGYELANVADSSQKGVEMFRPFFRPFTLGNLNFQISAHVSHIKSLAKEPSFTIP